MKHDELLAKLNKDSVTFGDITSMQSMELINGEQVAEWSVGKLTFGEFATLKADLFANDEIWNQVSETLYKFCKKIHKQRGDL